MNDLLNDLEENGTKTGKRTLLETLFSSRCYTELNYLHIRAHYLADKHDGMDYFATLMRTVKTDNDPLCFTVTKKWMLNSAAQVLGNTPASRNDCALIFTGGQGVGKSHFFQNLLWDTSFTTTQTSFNPQNKEHRLLMTEKVHILWDELGGHERASPDELKAVMSQDYITADKKFKNTARYPRVASFCGTTNKDAFLKDATGSRRFLPFVMLSLDFDAYDAVEKANLWSQIFAEYLAGASYRLTDEEKAAISTRNEDQFTADTPEDAFRIECVLVTGDPDDFVPSSKLSERLDEYRDRRKGQGVYRWDEVRKKLLQMPGVTATKKRTPGAPPRNGLSGVKLIFNGSSS